MQTTTRKWIRNTMIVAVVLVVAAVVLFPVFARTGGCSNKTQCINNMKQLGHALYMYTEENSGMLPSSYLIGQSKKWNEKDFVTFASFKGEAGDSGYRLGRTAYALLYPYMKNENIIWCPKDPNEFRDSAYSGVSYYYKAAVDRAWYGDKNGKFQRIDDYEASADQVVFWERSSLHWKDGDQTLRNGDSINVAYMDGHVATKRITNCGYSADENPPGPLPKSGKGEPAWFNVDLEHPNAEGPLWNTKTCYDNLD